MGAICIRSIENKEEKRQNLSKEIRECKRRHRKIRESREIQKWNSTTYKVENIQYSRQFPQVDKFINS